MVADASRQQLDHRYIPLERAVGQITTATLSLAALLALALVALFAEIETAWLVGLGMGWAALTAALAWLSHRWPELEFRRTYYVVGADEMEIQRGVLWRHATKVPRSRVQHTDVTQGPLERRYGLATLVIHTAGNEHARVSLPGLAHETALAIRDHFLPREHLDAV